MSESLKRKLNAQSARIAVVGLGYVGLPLAVSFAKKGFKVLGLDKDHDRIKRLKNKESYISDVSSAHLRRVISRKFFEVSTHFENLAHADCVIICVPTPLKRKYTPDISYIVDAVKSICRYLKKDTLVVLESTTYPGTTKELIKPELEKSGLKCEKDFYLSFSPERIDPGNKKYDITHIPKIVGGLSKISGELTKILYQKIIKEIHVVSSAEAAEMTKLLENTFRLINIGWVNEAAMICRKMNIDVWEVIDAAKTKPFGFMPFYPGLGVGGHCIPDDPLYLYWKAKHHGFGSKFIKLSSDINSHMPHYVTHRIKDLLASQRKNITKARLLVVGVTYKKDVKDLRKSPALKLIELLKHAGARVDYFDPIIPYLKILSIDTRSIKLNQEALKRYDCVVMATDHTHIHYDLIYKNARCIFDIKNIYRNRPSTKIEKL